MLAAATEREASLAVLLADKRVREHINDGDNNKDTALHHAYQSNPSPSNNLSLALKYPIPPSTIAKTLFEWVSFFVESRCRFLSASARWCLGRCKE